MKDLNEINAVKVSGETAPAATQPTYIQTQALGSSGIRNWSGYLAEEYLHELRGRRAADIFDKLYRSDSKIKKCVKATKDPIMTATWEVNPPDDADEDQKKIADFVKYCLFEKMDEESDFDHFVHEALQSMLIHGFAPFEKVHRLVLGDAEYGNFYALDRLAWRSPRTIEKWNIDKNTEKLVSVTQYAEGDAGKWVDIPAQNLVNLTLERMGANYEGISALRAPYGAWKRKQDFLKLLAIGIEKYAIPTPFGNVPRQSGPDFDMFIAALEAYTSHESNYLILPAGWSVDMKPSVFDAEKIVTAIDRENLDIVDSFATNFLELGMAGGASGGRALSMDMSGFFLSSLTQVAHSIAGKLNTCVIKGLVDLKYGPQSKYPKIIPTGISDKAGKEFAETMNFLAGAKIITPDDTLEDNVRKRMDLPKRDEATARTINVPGLSPGGQITDPAPVGKTFKLTPEQASISLSESEKKLAEKRAIKQIAQGGDDLLITFQSGLTNIGERLIGEIMKKMKGLSEEQRIAAIKKIDVAGLAPYRRMILGAMAQVADTAIISARRDVPKMRNLKLAEYKDDAITLDDEFDEAWKRLPKKTKKMIAAQSELLVASQTTKLKDSIMQQFLSSVGTDSDRILEDDLTEALNAFLQGPSITSASSTLSSNITNFGRLEFFDTPEVADQIDAFEFVNGDPVSPICSDLAGTVFAVDDPNRARYMPPLHHNCKSYIMPILKGNLGDKKIKKIGPSRASLEKFIKLAEDKFSY